MASGKSMVSMKRNKSLMDFIFVAPQFLLYLAFTIIPFFIALPLMFQNYVNFLTGNMGFAGLDNFSAIFKEPLVNEFLPAVGKTALFTLINYGSVYIFGLSLALLMYEFAASRFKDNFFVVIFMPYIVSGLGVGMILNVLFASDTGTINLLLLKLGLIQEAFDIKDPRISSIALPLVVGWRVAGFNMSLFLSALLSIPTDTIESSVIDGANYPQRLRYIYLPQIASTIIIATILCLLGSFGVFDEAVGMGALYGNESVKYLAVLLFKLGFSGGGTGSSASGTLSQAITMSMVVYLPLLIGAVFLTKLQKRLQY